MGDGKDESGLTLGVLSAVQEHHSVSQREIAHGLGVALGLANATMKRCISKGLIKITQVRSNQLRYFLTPAGFMEKARLTSEFLSQSFKMFRTARTEYTELMELCVVRDWRFIAFYGNGELAEIAFLCAREAGIEPQALIDPGSNQGQFLGISRLSSLDRLPDLGHVDAVILCQSADLVGTYETLSRHFAEDRILAPRMLSFLRQRTLADTGHPPDIGNSFPDQVP